MKPPTNYTRAYDSAVLLAEQVAAARTKERQAMHRTWPWRIEYITLAVEAAASIAVGVGLIMYGAHLVFSFLVGIPVGASLGALLRLSGKRKRES